MTLVLAATSASTSPSHSRCACALSRSHVISIWEVIGTINGKKRVRQQRNNAERFDTGCDQRPACRQEVGSRSGRRCHTNAVRSDAGDGTLLKTQPKRNDARDFAFAHYDVVEREESSPAVLGLEGGPFVHEESALDQRREIGKARIVFVELRKKA